MSDCMTQADAERMDNKQAINILVALWKMMLDQHGCPVSDAYFALGKAIDALSTIDRAKWIPVSEGLPKEFGDYLVSIKRVGWNCEEYVENDIAYWDDLEGWHKGDTVTAWMPLPEPWKGEEG